MQKGACPFFFVVNFKLLSKVRQRIYTCSLFIIIIIIIIFIDNYNVWLNPQIKLSLLNSQAFCCELEAKLEIEYIYIYIYSQSLEKIQLNFNRILNFMPCVPFNF